MAQQQVAAAGGRESGKGSGQDAHCHRAGGPFAAPINHAPPACSCWCELFSTAGALAADPGSVSERVVRPWLRLRDRAYSNSSVAGSHGGVGAWTLGPVPRRPHVHGEPCFTPLFGMVCYMLLCIGRGRPYAPTTLVSVPWSDAASCRFCPWPACLGVSM